MCAFESGAGTLQTFFYTSENEIEGEGLRFGVPKDDRSLANLRGFYTFCSRFPDTFLTL